MEEKRKIKFAVVGSGHIGKRHAEMIRRNSEAELVAMCDIKPKADLGLNDLEVPFFNSIEELFQAGLEFDVVNVCSPNGLHAEHTLVALDHKKHVVIEKPMGLTVADCEKSNLQGTTSITTGFLRDAKPVLSPFCLDQGCRGKKSSWKYLHGPVELLLEP